MVNLANYRFNDPMQSVERGYEFGNALRQDGAKRRAGNALRGGDLGAAAGELYGEGLLSEGAAIENRQAQQAEVARSREAETAKAIADDASRLRQLYDATPGDAQTKKARVMAGFEQIAPRWRQLGEKDDELAQFRSQLDADPDMALFALGAGAAKKAGYEIVKSSDGSYVAVDTGTGRPAYQFRPATTVKLGEGDQLLELPGTEGGMAPEQPIAAPEAPQPGADAPLTVAALDALPSRIGGRITSGQRTREHNAAVGGVQNSKHLTNEARDLVPPPGVSMDEFERQVRASVPEGVQVINEGDHIHVEIDGGPKAQPTRAQGPRVIASRPKAAKPQQVRLSPQEVEAAGYQPGSVVFRDPTTGEETVKQGPGAGSGKITDGMRNVASLTHDMLDANEQMNSLADSGTFKPTAQVLVSEQNGVTRLVARNQKDAQFVAAANAWLIPLLRKETGAAVTAGELQTYMDTYIPQPSDSPQVIRQKAAARRSKMLAMLRQSKPAYEDQFGAIPGQISTKYQPYPGHDREGRGGQQPPAQAQVQIPGDAINALKRDPRLAGQFDAKYGKGQAAKVLAR